MSMKKLEEKKPGQSVIRYKIINQNNFKFTIASRILNNKETAMRDGFNKLLNYIM